MATSKRAQFAIFVWAGLTLAVGGCREQAGPGRPGANVILISIDTLRPDHLGCYGYPRPTSPWVDRFRNEAVLFREVIAQAPSTLPSHASILTSLLPQHHGASLRNNAALPDAAVTLAEVLRNNGYRTAAFTGGGQMDPMYGFDQGFDIYELVETDFFPVVRRGLSWLDDEPEQPFFLFLHTFETHHPYVPEKRHLELFEGNYEGPLPDGISGPLLVRINSGEIDIDEADVRHIVNAYDGEIHSMDAAFGALIRQLKRRKLYENTVLVFTSDHGEEFGEHGKYGWHSHTLYDELLRVPLLIKLPGDRHAGTEVSAAVRSLDIAPTILQAVGLEAPPQFQGESLLSFVSGKRETGLATISSQDVKLPRSISSLRSRRWKLHSHRTPHGREVISLYDLRQDPGEQIDLASERPLIMRRLQLQLRWSLTRRRALAPDLVEPDGQTLERLRALGYVN